MCTTCFAFFGWCGLRYKVLLFCGSTARFFGTPLTAKREKLKMNRCSQGWGLYSVHVCFYFVGVYVLCSGLIAANLLWLGLVLIIFCAVPAFQAAVDLGRSSTVGSECERSRRHTLQDRRATGFLVFLVWGSAFLFAFFSVWQVHTNDTNVCFFFQVLTQNWSDPDVTRYL